MAFDDRTYAVKELPSQAARQDYEVLQQLKALAGPAVRPAGLVIRNDKDSTLNPDPCSVSSANVAQHGFVDGSSTPVGLRGYHSARIGSASLRATNTIGVSRVRSAGRRA